MDWLSKRGAVADTFILGSTFIFTFVSFGDEVDEMRWMNSLDRLRDLCFCFCSWVRVRIVSCALDDDDARLLWGVGGGGC